MRGIFTAGVLDAFHETHETFDLIVGVSAGACCAVSYLGNQPGRNRRIFMKHMTTKSFYDPVRLFLGGSMADMDFIMGPVTFDLEPLDHETMCAHPTRLYTVSTHAHTGEPCYLPAQGPDWHAALFSTVAIPFFYTGGPIRFRHEDHFDGGVADPIPLQFAIDQGATDITVVTTRPPSWQPPKLSPVSRTFLTFSLADYPEIPGAIARRAAVYHRTREVLVSPPENVTLTHISPPEDFPVARFTMDPASMQSGYEMGLEAGKRS